uniref:hypothetical protein n=1 Tax=Salmonella enterica TaxID=28901 RepID=UPI00398C6AA2
FVHTTRWCVVLGAGEMWGGGGITQQECLVALERMELAVKYAGTAAYTLFLIFPGNQKTIVRLTFYVVDTGVFLPVATGPDVVTGY